MSLDSSIASALGAEVRALEPVPGGDICEAWKVTLADGGSVFAKSHPQAPPTFFSTEALWLRWLHAAEAINVPRVLAVLEDPVPALILEWVQRGAPYDSTAEHTGRRLAELHRAGAPQWGATRPGHLGPLVLPNEATDSWAEFWSERRLRPTVRAVAERGVGDIDLVRRVDALCARLDRLVDPSEPPARLHGDLWAGNLIVDEDGEPWLVDPFSYGGHREVDLAMMRLFGGFAPRTFDAYSEVHPLPAGWEERVGLYQLFPLLVHCLLFGEAYLAQTLAALGRYE